jgi:hypothetical protein
MLDQCSTVDARSSSIAIGFPRDAVRVQVAPDGTGPCSLLASLALRGYAPSGSAGRQPGTIRMNKEPVRNELSKTAAQK